MNEKTILDANILVGYFDKDDLWHSKAVQLMERKGIEGIILDCVLNEVFSVLCRRAVERGKGEQINQVIDAICKAIPPEIIIWTYPNIINYYKNILLLMKEHEGKLNFHDCLIALVAREKNIKRIMSFDRDFDRITWLERTGG